jgi:hypothetical protein
MQMVNANAGLPMLLYMIDDSDYKREGTGEDWGPEIVLGPVSQNAGISFAKGNDILRLNHSPGTTTAILEILQGTAWQPYQTLFDDTYLGIGNFNDSYCTILSFFNSNTMDYISMFGGPFDPSVGKLQILNIFGKEQRNGVWEDFRTYDDYCQNYDLPLQGALANDGVKYSYLSVCKRNSTYNGTWIYRTTEPVASSHIPTKPVITILGNTPDNASTLVSFDISSSHPQGIREYEYAFGTLPGQNDLLDWTFSTSSGNSVRLDRSNIPKNQEFFISARAHSNGVYSSAVSVSEVLMVPDAPHKITVSPASASVNVSASRQFTAIAYDQDDAPLSPQPTFAWSINGGGAISSNGMFTAGMAAGGPYIVTATSGSVSGTSSVTVTSNPTPVYRINTGSSSAASPFTADRYGSGGTMRTVTNTINMTGVSNPAPQAVYQSERYGTSTYTLPNLPAGSQYTVRLHFAELYWTATGKRVFNVLINGTTVLSNFDIYAAAGARYKAAVQEFLAAANGSGQIVIKFNAITDNPTIEGIEIITTIPNNPPTVAAAAAASPNPVTRTTATLSVLGADDNGEGNLTYTWATTGTPPAAVTFSANGTNAAKNTTVTFALAGSYSLQATVRDAGNLTATSPVTVAVNQTLTGIILAPATATVNTSATQQFTATARDQFLTNLTTQPPFTWSLSGGGTISPAGLFTAGTVAGGPYTVTATSGSVSGTSSVTVHITTYSLTTSAMNGTITLNPAGGTYASGTVVTLTATPKSGYKFSNWSGSVSGTSNPTTITMNANKTVTANFTAAAVVVNLEAESLPRTSSAIGTNVSNESGASGGAYVYLNSGAASGDWVQFALPSIAAGAYAVTIYYKAYFNRGINLVTIDGTAQGGACDEYSSSAVFQKTFAAGKITFGGTATHTMRFTVTNKNNSSSGYVITVDKIVFTPQ